MRERAVEAAAARERDELRDARAGRERLAERGSTPPWRPITRERMAPVLEQLDRVRERPRRELDLVPVLLERLDERAQHEDVGGVREVDPDAHRRS